MAKIELDSSARDACHIEYIIEQPNHMDDLTVHDLIRIHRNGIVGGEGSEQFERSANRREWIAQLMAEHGEKLFPLSRRVGQRHGLLAQVRFHFLALAELCFQTSIELFELESCNGVIDRVRQLSEVIVALDNVVIGAQLQRRNRSRFVALSGDHYERHIDLTRPCGSEQVRAR